MAKAAACLERLDEKRVVLGDPNLGKSIEERIIWRELLDLELQEFDEQIERLSEVGHSLIPDVGMVTRVCGKAQQQPERQSNHTVVAARPVFPLISVPAQGSVGSPSQAPAAHN